MEPTVEELRKKLTDKGLKITPQRIAILDAVYRLGNHPTADQIIEYIRQTHPNIASGTVYKVLDTLMECELVKKVTTDKNIMRYDGTMENHHHLYCPETDLIKDYHDEELDHLLKKYFQDHDITGFRITRFDLKINGSFEES